MLRKMISLLVVLGAVCGSAYASNKVVYQSADFPARTAAFGSFGQVGKNYPWGTDSYEEFFNVVNSSQLVYHHPDDYSADTYEYYMALVQLSYNADSRVRAFLNGEELPVAVVKHKVLLSKYQYANIVLTQEDLVNAYEDTGKLILKVVVGKKTYDVVFPQSYLRTVLANTTRILQYQLEEQAANPPAPVIVEQQPVVVVHETRPLPPPKPRPHVGPAPRTAHKAPAHVVRPAGKPEQVIAQLQHKDAPKEKAKPAAKPSKPAAQPDKPQKPGEKKKRP